MGNLCQKKKRWFELLVEGISKSKGISNSLADIEIYDWDIDEEEAQKVIQRFKMDRVRVKVKHEIDEISYETEVNLFSVVEMNGLQIWNKY